MADRPPHTSFEFTTRPQTSRPIPPATDEDEFRILILADLSGRASRGICDQHLAQRRPLKIDADNFDSVLAQLHPEIHLPIGAADGPRLPISFKTLDDFHPDHLFPTLPLFTRLRELHARLRDAATFPAAAVEARTLLGLPEPAPATAPASEPAPVGDAFSALLNKKATDPTPKTASPADELIRRIAAGTSVHADPEQARLIKTIEDALAAGLRAALRQPAFQRLEAAWRGVHRLATRLNTDELLKLYVLDVSPAELAADLAAAGEDLERSGTYKLLVEQTARTPGGTPWALVVHDQTYASTPDDVRLLAQLATLCAEIRAPLLAAADPSLIGRSSFDPSVQPDERMNAPADALWDQLRTMPQAGYVVLALPRVLLRLPYGPQTDPVEHYHFDEMSAPDHEAYLWGNPAFTIAEALAERFLEDGWAMTTGQWLQISDLPAHITTDHGTKTTQPCAETLLTDHDAEAIVNAGLTPVLSVKHQPAVRLPELITLTGQTLKGRWSE